MNRFIKTLTLVALAALLIPTLVGAQSADDPAATCDATLITLLLVTIQNYDYQPPAALEQYAFGPYSDQPTTSDSDALTVRQQAEDRVSQAAQTFEEEGYPGIAREIGNMSDVVGDVAEAGESLLEAGEAALQAGQSALTGTDDETGEMPLGVRPGEPETCTALRRNLVSFLYVQLTANGTE